jgi:hypothetical protein
MMKNNANENEVLMQGSKWEHPNSHNEIASLDILDWVGEVKWCALNNHIYDAMTRTLQHFKGQETTFWKIKNVYVHDANQTSYALSKCESSNMSNIKQKYQ